MASIGHLPAELLVFTADSDMVRARAGKVLVIGVCACVLATRIRSAFGKHVMHARSGRLMHYLNNMLVTLHCNGLLCGISPGISPEISPGSMLETYLSIEVLFVVVDSLYYIHHSALLLYGSCM